MAGEGFFGKLGARFRKGHDKPSVPAEPVKQEPEPLPFHPTLAKTEVAEYDPDARVIKTVEKLAYVFSEPGVQVDLTAALYRGTPTGDKTVKKAYLVTESGNIYEFDKKLGTITDGRKVDSNHVGTGRGVEKFFQFYGHAEIGKPFGGSLNYGEKSFRTSAVSGIVLVSDTPHDAQALMQMTRNEQTDIPTQFAEMKAKTRRNADVNLLQPPTGDFVDASVVSAKSSPIGMDKQ